MSSSSPSSEELTRGSLLARNTVMSILSKVLPMGIALVSIPILINQLGTDRFGVLTLVWMFIGYMAMMDLGLGRALVKFISERIGKGRDEEILGLTWTAVIMMGGVGLLLALIIYFASPYVVQKLFDIKPGLQDESINGLRIMGWVMPVMFTSIAMRSVLSAFQKFKAIAVIQVINSTLNYAAPLVVLLWFDRLEAVIGVLFAIKIVVLIGYVWQFSKQEEGFLKAFGWYQEHVKELLTFGGWVSVSNVISPIIDQADRFLLATMFSMTMVAYYTTPLEMILKVSLLPVGVMTVFFPAISTSVAAKPEKAVKLMNQALKGILFMTFPVVLGMVLFAKEGLMIWVGPEFATNSALLAQILSIGILLKSLSHMPLAFLHSIDRPDLTAKIHLLELLAYSLVLYGLTKELGLMGAALAHTIRLASDMFIMMFVALRNMKSRGREKILRETIIPALIMAGVLTGVIFIKILWVKILLFLTIGALFGGYGWYYMLNKNLRSKLIKLSGLGR